MLKAECGTYEGLRTCLLNTWRMRFQSGRKLFDPTVSHSSIQMEAGLIDQCHTYPSPCQNTVGVPEVVNPETRCRTQRGPWVERFPFVISKWFRPPGWPFPIWLASHLIEHGRRGFRGLELGAKSRSIAGKPTDHCPHNWNPQTHGHRQAGQDSIFLPQYIYWNQFHSDKICKGKFNLPSSKIIHQWHLKCLLYWALLQINAIDFFPIL